MRNEGGGRRGRYRQHSTTQGRPLPSYQQSVYQHPGEAGFLDRLAREPKAHSTLMFTSPGKKLSVLKELIVVW